MPDFVQGDTEENMLIVYHWLAMGLEVQWCCDGTWIHQMNFGKEYILGYAQRYPDTQYRLKPK